jgi:hypothetical protein
MNQIVDEGRRFAATADMNISDMSSQAPVGTTLALLERQLKVLTAVQARVHFALKQELKLIKNLIRDYTDTSYTYEPEYGSKKAKKEDYDLVDVIPVSDPNAATMSQRVVQYQAVIQMAQMAPQIYDLPQLHRSMLDVLGIKNAEKLVPLPDDQKPTDPVSENMQVLKGKPLKAFMYQDHQAHISVHMSLIQNPMIMQIVGQNPMAQQMMAAMQAHMAEHAGYLYRQKVEQQLGMPMPPEDEKLPPQLELALSTMMAQASNQVLQQDQAQAAQMQAQQAAQDPVLQMQQQELAIRQAEVQIKGQKANTDAKLAMAKLALEREKTQDTTQLNAMKVGAQIENDKHKLANEEQQAGLKAGMDMARNQEQTDLQRKQAMLQHLQTFKKEQPKE